MRIIDTHAHYDDARYDEDRDLVLRRQKDAGIDKIINIGADFETSLKAVEIAKEYDFVYASVGVHPECVASTTDEMYEKIAEMSNKENARANKIVAIGEAGLDYHYDEYDIDLQKRHFAKNIEIAVQNSLPLIVHSRDAAQDTIDTLKKENAFRTKVVYHCFAGSGEQAKELAKLGCYFSLGGVVTFKNARKSHEALLEIPRDRLMLETDSPYLAPEPVRGTRNESANIRYIAAVMAQILGFDDVDELCEITSQNAERFFEI